MLHTGDSIYNTTSNHLGDHPMDDHPSDHLDHVQDDPTLEEEETAHLTVNSLTGDPAATMLPDKLDMADKGKSSILSSDRLLLGKHL